ncbi:DUF418 domain-containing protein [Sphingomonas sp. AR_OL41]|uniref:DUF418 domain-containing protein n=1 Tax=Sphingomonas sp. AR_OL41 TaxID=3042729 RepID=UPI0024804C9B|nr:DUF418 domain-containing protein [Sphingomonas sp. AR_OL41]MDH7974566.1 DUF418 domain-containing protein [Sphingomonas sp. AR_OL41]
MTDSPARVATLDVIRGVAVMGILLMNIVAFGMPEVAYSNPAAFGSHGAIDYGVWAINFVLVDGKMRGLFSFLFGASMLLVIERAEAKGESPLRVHYARMLWLFLFGLAHLYFVWWGDILNHYALVGALAFPFRRMAPHKLVIIAVILIALETLLTSTLVMSIAHTQATVAAHTADAATLRQYHGFIESFGRPDAAFLAHDVAVHRGGYAAVFVNRLAEAASSPINTLIFVGMETLGYMLLGMACFRSGMLRGAWPRTRYRAGLMIGFGIGIPAYVALLLVEWRGGFDAWHVALGSITLSTPFRPIMIIGWVCLIILLARPGGALTERIAAAGRMAFSNYLGTSLICSTLFYGYGAGLYGQLSRAELYLVVAGVWALMLLWSKPWLEHFRYGPLEWLWRSLARGKLQPMRGAAGG